MCLQAAHTPRLGKVVLWAEAKWPEEPSLPRFHRMLAVIRVPAHVARTPKLRAMVGNAFIESRSVSQHLDLRQGCLWCAVARVTHSPLPYRNGESSKQ